ncbi:carbon-nitrogen family hydrolase [Paenibacillus sp. OAS669]|uniref:carbon-nitrogen family hydrolase n=1 Tax=Paenibacillus sp. OAS669 TaxID=2663821 RepID=UPI00178B5C4E|nr:carbon-nitrogen family hydrolase [Paenibacillus sp. OAS669]MBE1444121.1 putative amidohydrolase [Paenibacillus sp. OAS669]
MKVASIQLEIKAHESKAQRVERASVMVDKAAQDADLILLPEIWATGYFSFDKYVEEAETIDGPLVRLFSEKARQHGVYLFAGSFVELKDGKYYNTSILFDRQGKLIGTYAKTHLFRYGSQEGELLTAGDGAKVFDTEFGKVGLTTCYDLRFPELYRQQVDLGAELLLVTSAWPHQRLEHWKLFNAARALENQCFLISCNCVGTTRNVLLGGHSSIVDPWGVTVASGGEHETIVKAEIDPSEVQRIRDVFPSLKHRVL